MNVICDSLIQQAGYEDNLILKVAAINQMSVNLT